MKVCIIEDEKLLADWIAKKLTKDGYNVDVYYNASDFINSFSQSADLYVLDIWLPDSSWYEIIDFLREWKKVNSPIIISSWYSDVENKIHWLNIWADDYIVKPFLPEELVARIKALIRRSYSWETTNILKYKNYTFDTTNKIIRKWKEQVKLSKKEMDIVEYFMFNKLKLIKKATLISSVWWEHDWLWVSDNTINVTISRVRKKLWDNFNLVTIVWEWYMLRGQ